MLYVTVQTKFLREEPTTVPSLVLGIFRCFSFAPRVLRLRETKPRYGNRAACMTDDATRAVDRPHSGLPPQVVLFRLIYARSRKNGVGEPVPRMRSVAGPRCMRGRRLS